MFRHSFSAIVNTCVVVILLFENENSLVCELGYYLKLSEVYQVTLSGTTVGPLYSGRFQQGFAKDLRPMQVECASQSGFFVTTMQTS